jgi:uncharacterized protein
VLVSIGYSACHWCHVMAHESFEDPETAALMNELFVSVKVDREERPDVDAIYMDATQAMSGHGGWPMTVFVTPDGEPFYCGTYFPKEPRAGMPAFTQVCRAVAEAWTERRDAVKDQAGRLTAAIARSADLTGSGRLPDTENLQSGRKLLIAAHDDERGGFGGAPKFPQAMSLELLLRAGAVDQVTTSLDAMASGGMYDHLGGGFARYSVDAVWLVPHFEKMLYDQALLARVYLHAWLVTGEVRFRQVLEETIDYVLRDLRHPDGGFYSSEDADSEGEEGRFYLWTPEEVSDVLGPTADAAMEWWGVTPSGNFEGRTILNRLHRRGQLLRPPAIEDARRRLFEARELRERPGLDDKILAEWNGLMLSTLAEAAAATGRDDWLAAAMANGEFLLAALRRPDGRWLRSWQGGRAHTLGFAADHAAVADAFTRLAEATGETRWIDAAQSAAHTLLDRFWDDERGGVFTTGEDGEALVTRPKDLLGALTGEDRLTRGAHDIVGLLGVPAVEHPTAFAHLLTAAELLVGGITELVVAGDRPDLVGEVQRRYLPSAVLAWGERYDSPLWEGREDGRAYVCRNYTCQLPATTVDQLAAQLETVGAIDPL